MSAVAPVRGPKETVSSQAGLGCRDQGNARIEEGFGLTLGHSSLEMPLPEAASSAGPVGQIPLGDSRPDPHPVIVLYPLAFRQKNAPVSFPGPPLLFCLRKTRATLQDYHFVFEEAGHV